MALEPGAWLNHYRILAPIGSGGMGEVYAADDTRLKRRVALKILPPEATEAPDRYLRFEREAQALASLNHPNIVTIYSVEESGGIRFITMERVDGQPLDRLIPEHGLPLADLLRYAIPIVDAVAAAHERGVVHRDLKPANVMVTADGRVKVLDFGLAKLVGVTCHADGLTTATAAMDHTSEGRIVGTAAYMAPEQAEGRGGDHRSDIFSLGILLYEMTAGVRPFTGASTIAVLSSIIKDDPPSLVEINPAISPEIDAQIGRCLAKRPEDRWQSAADLRDRLRELDRLSSGEHSTAVVRSTPWRWLWPAGGAVIVLLIGLAAVAWLATRGPAQSGAFDLGVPTFTRATSGPGLESWPTLSADGRWLAYAASEGGQWDIHVKAPGDEAARNLTAGGSSNDTMPAFSPDGRQIAFRSDRDGGGIFVMTMSGESVRRVVDHGYDPAWSADATEIFFATGSGGDPDARFAPSELWAVNVQTERTRSIAPVDAVAPRPSPDGRLVAYWALPVSADGRTFAGGNRDIWVRPVAGGEAVRVTDAEGIDWNPVWGPEGRSLLFSSDRSGTVNLWRVAVDPASGRPLEDPQPLTTPALWAGFIASSGDGATIAYAAYDFTTNAASIGFDPDAGVTEGEERIIVGGTRAWMQPDVSPDGTLLALRSARAQEDIYVVNSDGTGLRALTSDAALDRTPRWMPDGRSLVFYSTRSGGYQFWSVQPDGSGLRQLTHAPDTIFNYPVPSPDGRWLGGTNPNTREQFIVDLRDPTRAPERLPAPPASVSAVYLNDWSPDGTRIAAHESPTGGLWMYLVEERRWERIAPAGAYPRWLPDSQRIVATRGGHIVLVDTRAKESREVYAQPGRRIGYAALSRDGRRLHLTSGSTGADVWLMRFGKPPS
jgi:Tol biopolymer transport system component/tRNA A-37 threonylcarbamoyl transferase component Bud32